MTHSDFLAFLQGLTKDFTPVIDPAYKKEGYAPIDLSPANPKLSEEATASSESFSYFMSKFLEDTGAEIAYGGYLEPRKLYRRSELFTASEDEERMRNIHLGLDVWAGSGTDVLAVLDGSVHSFRDNAAFGDYGPTIILEHNIQDTTFFTLYGHLSRSSLKDLVPGSKVGKGEVIGQLGAADENGDYAPHLHFQIIRDLHGRTSDFPGVSSRAELDHYLTNCPDPDLLLKIRDRQG